jgi:hypothetical protein
VTVGRIVLASWVALAAAAACSTFATEDDGSAVGDGGTGVDGMVTGDADAVRDGGGPSDSGDAAGAVRLCEARAGTFDACEDFEGTPKSSGWQRATMLATIDEEPSAGMPGTSAAVKVGPFTGARQARLFHPVGNAAKYRVEAMVKIEAGSVGPGKIELALIELEGPGAKRLVAIDRRPSGTQLTRCVAAEGGSYNCTPELVPEQFEAWTRLALELDVVTGAVTFELGPAKYPRNVMPLLTVDNGTAYVGASYVEAQDGPVVIRFDDAVLVTTSK